MQVECSLNVCLAPWVAGSPEKLARSLQLPQAPRAAGGGQKTVFLLLLSVVLFALAIVPFCKFHWSAPFLYLDIYLSVHSAFITESCLSLTAPTVSYWGHQSLAHAYFGMGRLVPSPSTLNSLSRSFEVTVVASLQCSSLPLASCWRK